MKCVLLASGQNHKEPEILGSLVHQLPVVPNVVSNRCRISITQEFETTAVVEAPIQVSLSSG